MAELHKVGTLEELEAKSPIRARIDGQDIAVFSLEDGIVAVNGRCPHANGPLFRGEVIGTEVTCPWHGWVYDLRSGACHEDPELFLERYEVKLQGSDIFILK